MTEMPSRPPVDRAAAIARATALQAERAAASPDAPQSPTPRPRAAKKNTGSRILVAGAAASAGIVMVGAMAGAARAGSANTTPVSAPQVIERVVMIEVPAAIPADTTVDPVATATSVQEEVTVVREVRVLPAPPQDPVPAPAPTQGS
jgi:hypothetical protein